MLVGAVWGWFSLVVELWEVKERGAIAECEGRPVGVWGCPTPADPWYCSSPRGPSVVGQPLVTGVQAAPMALARGPKRE
eukprot:12413930-Heterocapsa_arctica.AAC.1